MIAIEKLIRIDRSLIENDLNESGFIGDDASGPVARSLIMPPQSIMQIHDEHDNVIKNFGGIDGRFTVN